MTLRLHRRQFVVARSAVAPDESWHATPLAEGWVLSHQADLALELDRADPDRPRAVLGHRFGADADGRGAGRFVRLDWPRVATDPVALLGVFHGRMGDAFALGSSPALVMLALTGEVPPYDITDPLEHRRGLFNYVPAPGSRWRAVRRLFCDQTFDLSTGVVEHADHGIRPLAGFAAAVETVAEELVRFAHELAARTPGRVVLPLTAGIDSRTVAAAFLAAGIAFETTTQRYIGKPPTDVRIAAAISRRFGLRHQVVDLEPPVPGIAELLERHICGAMLGWDISHIFPGNGYRYLHDGDAMIVAGCFELGRQYFARQLGDLDFATASGAAIWERPASPPGPPGLTGFLDAWRDWRGAHPDGLDWVNAFYLDQRLGAWRASAEHGYDLLPMVALHPANNTAVLSALVTPEPADQAAGRLQRAVIARLEPALMRFPINPPTLVQRLRWLKRGVRRRIAAAINR